MSSEEQKRLERKATYCSICHSRVYKTYYKHKGKLIQVDGVVYCHECDSAMFLETTSWKEDLPGEPDHDGFRDIRKNSVV